MEVMPFELVQMPALRAKTICYLSRSYNPRHADKM